MSYILDALKKSDRERQQETPVHLQHLYETSPSFAAGTPSRKRRLPFLLLFGLLLSGGLVKWWIDSNRQGPEGETLPRPAHAPTEMAVQQESVGQASMPAAAGGGKNLSALTVQEEWFDEWFQHLPKSNFPLPSEEDPPPVELGQEGFSPVVLTATHSKKITGPLKIARDREKVLLAPQDDTTVIRQPEPTPSVVGQSVPQVVVRRPEPAPSVVERSAPPVVTRQPEPAPSVVRRPEPAPVVIEGPPPVPSEKPGSDLPYLQDLPPHVQAEIPQLQFAGHAYALNPAQRLIVINGMIMREGDPIDAATRLAEITWEGVVIDRKGVRFQVKCY